MAELTSPVAPSRSLRRYGPFRGLILTCWLPVLPFFLMFAELIKRLAEMLPWAETDWKMKGPGRVFFTRPDSLVASVLWDFYLSVSVFSGTFLQYSNDPDGLMHTWYASKQRQPAQPQPAHAHAHTHTQPAPDRLFSRARWPFPPCVCVGPCEAALVS